MSMNFSCPFCRSRQTDTKVVHDGTGRHWVVFCRDCQCEGTDGEQMLEVTGDVSAYYEATFLSPAEGGVVTTETVEIAQTGQKMSEGDLTAAEVERIEDAAELQGVTRW